MPADKLIIVAEGRTDVLLMRLLLSKELTTGMRFFAGQGRESLATLARNLLVHEGGPLLLVMDVATAELPFQDELLAQAMQTLSTVGTPGSFQVFTFTPEIEIIFFEAPDAVQRVLGIPLSAGVLEEGQACPKIILHRLLNEAGVPNVDVLIRKLSQDEEAIEILCRGKQAIALREKVKTFRRVETGAGS